MARRSRWRRAKSLPLGRRPATAKLWALTSEVNGIAQADLAAFHNDGGVWSELAGRLAGGSGGYSYTQGDVASFSPFLLGATGSNYNESFDEFIYLPLVIDN